MIRSKPGIETSLIELIDAIETMMSWAVTLKEKPTTTFTTVEMMRAFNDDVNKANKTIRKIKELHL